MISWVFERQLRERKDTDLAKIFTKHPFDTFQQE